MPASIPASTRTPPATGAGVAARRASDVRRAGAVTGAALGAMGLMAGLFWSYSISVMTGLARADDRTFVTAMQRINTAIQNPVFFLGFFGAFALPAAAAVLQRKLGARAAFRWTVAAVALYGVALLVTMGVNVPLNDQLDRAGDADLITDLAAVRDRFEGRWVAFNHLRTLANVAGFAALARAAQLQARELTG